jgi:hypothetical protein
VYACTSTSRTNEKVSGLARARHAARTNRTPKTQNAMQCTRPWYGIIVPQSVGMVHACGQVCVAHSQILVGRAWSSEPGGRQGANQKALPEPVYVYIHIYIYIHICMYVGMHCCELIFTATHRQHNSGKSKQTTRKTYT